MAAPVVTGTVALMLQANPALTPNAVKAILQYTARVYAGYDPLTQGAGFLNAKGAVELARISAAPATPPYPDTVRVEPAVIWGNRAVQGRPAHGRRQRVVDGASRGVRRRRRAASSVEWGRSHGGDRDAATERGPGTAEPERRLGIAVRRRRLSRLRGTSTATMPPPSSGDGTSTVRLGNQLTTRRHGRAGARATTTAMTVVWGTSCADRRAAMPVANLGCDRAECIGDIGSVASARGAAYVALVIVAGTAALVPVLSAQRSAAPAVLRRCCSRRVPDVGRGRSTCRSRWPAARRCRCRTPRI